MAQVGSLFVRLGLNDASFVSGLRRAASQTESTMKTIQSSIRAASAAFAGLAVAAGGRQVLSGIVAANREYQKLSAMLVTATGSVSGAAQAFGRLQKFAATTPYSLNETVDAFIKLKNLGLDPSEDALRSFGNTAAAMGKPLNQMIEAVADAATGEFERLKEFGIKARQQGTQVSLTFQGVTKTIGNNSAEITKYLTDIGNVEFAGAMDRQAKTLDGRLSNLADSAAALARAIGDAGLNDALGVMIDLMTAASQKTSWMITQLRHFSDEVRGMASIVRSEGWIAGIASNFTGRAYRTGLTERTMGGLWSTSTGRDLRTAGQTSASGAPATGGAGNPAKSADSIRRAAEAAKRAEEDAVAAWLDEMRYNNVRLEDQADFRKRMLDGLGDGSMAALRNAGDLTLGKQSPFATLQDFTKSVQDAWFEDSIAKPLERAREFSESISKNLAQAIVYGQNLGSALVNSFKAAAAEALANGLMQLLLGAGSGGGLFGSIFSGLGSLLSRRAGGGPVSAGKAYLVGERGPEMLVPSSAGSVISNSALMAGGMRVEVVPSQYFDVRVSEVSTPIAARAAVGAVGQSRSDLRSASRVRLPRSAG